MAHTETLPPEIRDLVARGIGERLAVAPHSADLRAAGLLAGAPAEAAFEMGESFPVYVLDAGTIRNPSDKFEDSVRFTNTWHHQVRHGGRAERSARSSAAGRVVELIASPIAAGIDKAIAWIDSNTSDDPLACLVMIPSYLTTAVWLKHGDRDEIVVADRPARLAAALEPLKIYPARELMDRLAKFKPVSAAGATLPEPPTPLQVPQPL